MNNFIQVNYEKRTDFILKLNYSIARADLLLNLNFCLDYHNISSMMESQRNILSRTSPKRQKKLQTITDQTNPEDSFILASEKKIRNTADVLDQSQHEVDRKMAFRGQNQFILDKDEESAQINQTHKKDMNDDDMSMARLLEQCRQSILSLRRQLSQKNLQLQHERSRVKQLETKLAKSQDQVTRQHQLLSLYIENQKKTHFKQQHASCKELAKSDTLEHQNQQLNDQLKRLALENSQLKRKVSMMGNGVGKALETIRKRTNSKEQRSRNRQESNQSIKSRVQQGNRTQQYGKIVTRYRNRTSPGSVTKINSIEERNIYITPSKNTTLAPYNHQTQTKLTFSTQPTASTQFLMKLISTKAKYFTQLEKIQSLVQKMQKLTGSQQSQQSDQESFNE